MNALTSPAVAARTRPPPTGRRAPAAAAPRRLLAPALLAASKKGAAPATAVSLTKGTEAERNRAAGLVLQGLLKQESARDEAVSQLTAKVAALESRLQKLELKAAAAQAPQPAEQTQKAAADGNRAEQLNPGCTKFWKSRNYKKG
jgi:hypothetical protein